jgi:hypothetical protein
MRESVSVKDFGAVGDGVTDDTAEVASAIASGASEVFFPAGTYNLTASGITMPSGCTLIGEGRGRTTLRPISAPSADFISGVGGAKYAIRDMTIDLRSFVCGALRSAIAFTSAADIDVRRCDVLNIDTLGIALNGCSRYTIADCYITKAAPANSQNQGILTSHSAGACSDGFITGNVLDGSAMNVSSLRCRITDNVIQNWGFGSGVTTEQNALSYGYTISGNIIRYSRGMDVNSTVCCGIENWGKWSLIANNQIYDCAGVGIDQGGQNCLIQGNIIWNNGQTADSPAIVGRYGDATYNGSGSVYFNNLAWDTSGTSGKQTYGYTDENANVLYSVVANNSFNGNKTAQALLLGSGSQFLGLGLTGSTTWNPGLLGNAASVKYNFTVPGAVKGDLVQVQSDQDLQGCILTAYVDATNSVSMVIGNLTGAGKTLVSGSFTVTVTKPSTARAW